MIRRRGHPQPGSCCDKANGKKGEMYGRTASCRKKEVGKEGMLKKKGETVYLPSLSKSTSRGWTSGGREKRV